MKTECTKKKIFNRKILKKENKKKILIKFAFQKYKIRSKCKRISTHTSLIHCKMLNKINISHNIMLKNQMLMK